MFNNTLGGSKHETFEYPQRKEEEKNNNFEDFEKTEKKINEVNNKIKGYLEQITIKLISLGNKNPLLLNELKNIKNNENYHEIMGNFIGICRKYINDPNVTSLLDQLQFYTNSLINQYKQEKDIKELKFIIDIFKNINTPDTKKEKTSFLH